MTTSQQFLAQMRDKPAVDRSGEFESIKVRLRCDPPRKT
jgi:hypothetical protein